VPAILPAMHGFVERQEALDVSLPQMLRYRLLMS